MANVKTVEITGEIPYCWSHELTGADAQLICAYLMGPTIGLHIGYGRSHDVPMKNGGRLATYSFSIGGQEAIRDRSLTELVAILVRAGAKITKARVMDHEAYGRAGARWETIPVP